jgi:rod shape-determining protein MreD
MSPLATLSRLAAIRLRVGGINYAPSPVLAISVPWLSILLASLLPLMPVIASAPVLPPFGLMLLIAWRQMRPGLLPVWAGLPLGMFDDIYSGQPFGSAILLWSLTMIALEVIEARIPWRSFWLNWPIAAAMIVACLVWGLVFANAAGGTATPAALVPQALVAVLLYPLVCRMVAGLDRFRLIPIVDLGP